MTEGRVILVDDEEEVRLAAAQTLELAGFEVRAFARADRALEHAGRAFDGVVVSDIRMPRMDGMELLAALHALDPDLPVILITGHGDVPLAVEAMRKGAWDFLEKPFPAARLADAASRAMTLRRLTLENRDMRSTLERRDPLEETLVGRSAAIEHLRERIRAVASADIDVLVLGDTGTGKELAARAIHDLSDRRERPFVAVNLAALPSAAIESELFGHEAGAFPGAHRARFGRFEHARGGTLFLDEIGAAPLALQAKLLRVIETRAIERIGSSDPIPLDARFVASSNRDLSALAAAGDFRDDLLYRLAVVTLAVPPLRDRPEDAPRLFRGFVDDAARRAGRPAPALEPGTLAALASRSWPGNVRELRNAAERFALGLGLDDDAPEAPEGPDLPLADQVDRFERAAIAAALARNEGALRPTYESLGLSRKTLYEKMQKHGLRRQEFVPRRDE